MHAMSRQHLVLLVALTLVWGVNWPIMKVGIMGYQPLSFRVLSMWIGLPVLALVLLWRREPFRIAREHWGALAWLTVFNMLFWHTLAVLAVQSLSSGRAAILGYTMPVFSAIVGAVGFAAKTYLPELLRRPPPAPAMPVMKNQEAATPAPAPAKAAPASKPAAKKHTEKHSERTSKKKSRGSAAAAETAPPTGDAPLPPSPE